MLDVRKLVKNYDDSATAFAELVPWMALIAPNVVLNKDGSLLACFEYEGMDAEGVEQYEIDRSAQFVEHAMRMFDERFTVWWTLDRRRTFVYPEARFENDISRYVDYVWREHFRASGQYKNRHYLSILYTPPGGVEGVFEKVAHYVKYEGMGLWKALAETTKSSLFGRAAFRYEAKQLEGYLTEFLDKMGAFEQAISDIRMRPLVDDDLLGFLHRRCTPTSTAEEIKRPDIPAYLDSYLAGATLVDRNDTLHFRGESEKFVGAVSIKDWPDMTSPGVLDALMAIPGEITVSQVLRVSSQDASRRYIQDVERHNRNMAKSIKTYVVESFTKEESRQVDRGKLALAEDASDALREISTAGRVYGHYNLTVLAFGETEREADELTKQVHRILSHQRFVAIRETMHLFACFSGTFPGQAGSIVRWSFVSTANLADLAPIRSLAIGDPTNPYFTEQYSSPEYPIPALTALPTEYATPFYFSFHQGDLGHALVVGPSRSGKSAFNNFLISQHQKYAPCHTFIFDKDYSCRIATVLQGGTHVDLAGERGEPIRLNPMLLLDDRKNWTWLANWIEILLTARGYVITSADSREVWTALSRTAEMPRSSWRLVTLGSLLPSHLHEQLAQWIGEGQKARYFDNDDDTFSIGSFTCVEMGRLFLDEVVARAFVEYAFYRISLKLDGRPTLIYIEEAWFMLKEPLFAAKINDWLRTLAKKNAWVIMATQSLDEIAHSDIFATIIDNIPTRVYLPNANAYAHRDMYRSQFGLNNAQIERIRNGIPKLNYYVVTPTLSRMINVPLPPEVLAVVRSDSKAQKVFDRHQASNDENWIENYLQEIVNGV